MSINKVQARALAEDFLGGIGSDPESFKPVECYTEALTIAGKASTIMADNCPVHNGKLAASITVETPEELAGGGISVSITMAKYGMYVDKGVKGTKGGVGLFAFKTDMPSKSMLKAISDYLTTAKAASATIRKNPIGKQEIKNKRLSDISSAFAMARSIKQHGIKPVNFVAKAIATIEGEYGPVLQDALIKDVYNSLPNTL